MRITNLNILHQINTFIQNATTAKESKNRVMVKIVEQQLFRVRQDVGKWRQALQSAESPDSPDRQAMYTLYADLIIDNHLESVMQTRRLNTLCKPFKVVSQATGKENLNKTKLLQKGWFKDFCLHAMDSIFYGHSLIEFGNVVDGHFTKVDLIPRMHVVPEKGIVKPDPSSQEGIPFREGSDATWLIEVGSNRDLGLLMKAGPTVIWKKGSMTAWPEFCEIFGMPLRKATDTTEDPERRRQLEQMLKKMGQAAYVVLQEGQEVEFVENAKGDAYNVFDKHIERMNSELSKLILGQTMTTDNGSSRSQAEVHERVADRYTKADSEMIETLVNEKLLPFLIRHGYPFSEDDRFEYDESEILGLLDLWNIADGLLKNGYAIDENYLVDTFGIPVTRVSTSDVGEGNATGEEDNAVGGARPILGYHIENGIVKKNEARAQLKLPAIDEAEDEKLRELQSKLAVVKAATDTGIPIEVALQLVGLEVKLPEPKPQPDQDKPAGPKKVAANGKAPNFPAA